jgi:Lsr2
MIVMVTKMSVIISDDLDGSGGAAPVSFGIDGTSYEVDLGAKNRAKLEKALAPFIAAGRRQPARAGRRRPSRASGPSVDNAAIRAWARSTGLQVSERGRISAAVIRQYEAAR